MSSLDLLILKKYISLRSAIQNGQKEKQQR